MNETQVSKCGLVNFSRKTWLWKIPLGILAAIVALLLLFVVVLTIGEYRPADVEVIPVTGTASQNPSIGDTFTILTMNTGFAALDENHDLFTNGGVEGLADIRNEVEANLSGMNEIIAEADTEIILLQEVDFKASRSFYIDEAYMFASTYGRMKMKPSSYQNW